MGQMLYQSKALIELSMKIFFSKFSDHFVQSYKRSKFWGGRFSNTHMTRKSRSQTPVVNNSSFPPTLPYKITPRLEKPQASKKPLWAVEFFIWTFQCHIWVWHQKNHTHWIPHALLPIIPISFCPVWSFFDLDHFSMYPFVEKRAEAFIFPFF